MAKSGLELMMRRLQEPVYDMLVELTADTYLSMQRRSSMISPANALTLLGTDTGYSIPLAPNVCTLPDAHTALECLANEEMEVRIHTDAGIISRLDYSDPRRIEVTLPPEAIEEDGEEYLRSWALSNGEELWRNRYNARMSYLQELHTNLAQETQSLVKDYITHAADRDRELVRWFDEFVGEVEQVDSLLDTEPALRWTGRILDVASLGFYSKSLQRNMDEYAVRDVAWQVIDRGAREAAEALRDDTTYLRDQGEEDLAQGIKEVSSFYGNICTFALQGQRRMRNLLNRAAHVYGMVGRVSAPDAESLGARVMDQVLDPRPRD